MIDFNSILPQCRVEFVKDCKSRKSALASAARLLAGSDDAQNSSDVLQALIEREELGSTALDESGVALPHCRLNGCTVPRAALLRLNSTVKFGPEWDISMIVALAVPSEATNEHLQILQAVARIFGSSRRTSQLMACTDEEQLHQQFLTFAADVGDS